MAIDDIENPKSPYEAFTGGDDSSINSQTTILLVLGALVPPDFEAVRTDLNSFRDEFPLPEVKGGGRLDTRQFTENFSKRFDLPIFGEGELSDSSGHGRRRQYFSEIGQQIFRNPTLENVGNLILLALNQPQELIRLAAAISFIDIFTDIGIGIRTLVGLAREGDSELTMALAETALSRFAYFPRQQAAPPTSPPSPSGGVSQNTSLLVHGTHFGFVGTPIPTWWKPGSDFHNYFKSNHRPNLYSKPDAYNWSGGWSDHARMLAAKELRDWLRNRQFNNADIVAHSHGGNVTMWATQLGATINKLVLLSCPNHMPRYMPEFSRVNEILSIQIKMDWIILADRGRTRFNNKKIKEIILPKWFKRHDDTHEPNVWIKYGLTA